MDDEHADPRFGDATVELRRADAGQVDLVLEVLNDAARWLRGIGVQQWPTAFSAPAVSPAIEDGFTWLAMRDSQPIGTITLDWADSLWPDDGDAGYVHRLAVRRSAAGLGADLLAWAVKQARAKGRLYLRLDCIASNQALRDCYERLGFVYGSEAEVGGSPGQRLATGRMTTVSLYELPLARSEQL